MKTWEFTVQEPLRGFPAHCPPWSDTAKRYVSFKLKVRLLANVAGVPEEIPPGYRATVSLDVTWKKKARIDLSNLQKSVEDGIFKKDRGIGEIHAKRQQHTGTEAIKVRVCLEREDSNVQGLGSKHQEQ